MADYKTLKVTDLKAELLKRNLPQSGKKEDLVARLLENDKTPTTTTAATDTEPAGIASSHELPSEASVSVPLPDLGASTATGTTTTTDPTETKETQASLDEQTAQVEAKLRARAARFGYSVPSLPAPITGEHASAELEKRKQRAARFGIPLAEEVALQKQAERLVKGAVPTQPRGDARRGEKQGGGGGLQAQQKRQQKSEGEKKQKETKRTASVLDDPEEAEKARKRALKFGNGAATPTPAATTSAV